MGIKVTFEEPAGVLQTAARLTRCAYLCRAQAAHASGTM